LPVVRLRHAFVSSTCKDIVDPSFAYAQPMNTAICGPQHAHRWQLPEVHVRNMEPRFIDWDAELDTIRRTPPDLPPVGEPRRAQ